MKAAHVLAAALALVGACAGPPRPASLETRFFRALWGTRRFELDSARLVLLAEDGTRLTFVPAGGGRASP